MDLRRIHSVELLELALDCARRLGYLLREDALGGFPGGACEFKGQKWLLLEPAQTPRERLQVVIDAIAADPAVTTLHLPSPLAQVVAHRRAA
jgi:hypothetical protein